jgi:hypothetical protein
MPRLNEATQSDLSGYTSVSAGVSQTASPPVSDLQPVLNSMIRCPLPPIFQASPDSLRQFYVGGKVPQSRLLTPAGSAVTASTSTRTTSFGTIVLPSTGGGTGGSGSAGTSAAQQAVLKTAVLNPNGKFKGVLAIAKGFQLLSVSVGSPCRVQLYGTAASQTQDLYRAIDAPPPAGTAQNIICDLVLDTNPYQWTFQNRVGSNGDNPQFPAVYVTITNLDATSDAISLTLRYVPLEN